MSVNLDDTNQSAFFIPYAGDENDEEDLNQDGSDSGFAIDIPGGDTMRWDAYRAAWTKCLNRVQDLVHALHRPVVNEVVEKVNSAFTNALPALPQPELPVIAVTNPSIDNVFLSEVVSQLDNEDILTTHLGPRDCPNLMTAMKTLMNGFMEHSANRSGFKSSTHSLAPYDIQVLRAWYDALVEDRDEGSSKPNLVVVLRDFEQFDPSIMQDIFYICSLHLPELPLVFIVFLSSPQTPSYMHVAYPRSTLALLRLHPIMVPSGNQVLEEVFMKTFVDLDYDPDIVVGPRILEYLVEYFTRYSPSIDAVLNILQLAHLKHFTNNPFTLFSHSTPPIPTLEDPSSFAFLDALLTRLNPTDSLSDWQTPALTSLIKSLDDARTNFHHAARCMRLGFGLLRLFNDFLTQRGYKGLEWGTRRDSPKPTLPRLFIKLLRGGLHRDISSARMLISKLKPVELREFLDLLVGFFQGLPLSVGQVVEEAQEKLLEFKGALEVQAESDSDLETSTMGRERTRMVASAVAVWMTDYISELTQPLEDTELWDLWYTGDSPFPSEIHNPSIRSSIIGGLLHPRDYSTLDTHTHQNVDDDNEDALWLLPDTSILFHRYLESGKMINVYDWFESFSVVLETQRREQKNPQAQAARAESRSREKAAVNGNGSPRKRRFSRSPTKAKANGKSPKKGKGKEKEEEEEVDEDDTTVGDTVGDDDDEKWKLVVQARFMRALHELDYMGFIKHTGRKPDHVIRTVFDMPE